jgi:hypothetical protein
MWFLTRIGFTDEKVELIKSYQSFEECWKDFREFLRSPESAKEGTLRMCEAETETLAFEKIRALREEDREVALAQAGSPDRVVRQWVKNYGVNMAAAAKLATDRLRGGKSQEDWAAEEGARLASIGFNPGEGKGSILRLIQRGNETATVEFSRTVSTKEGKTHLLETYELKNVGGRWLIDSVHTKEEHV